MRTLIVMGLLGVMVTGCASGSGLSGRKSPDEFAVSRAAPLIVPPDFALSPPQAGTPQAQASDSSTQALEAMFGGSAARSAAEKGALTQAGGARAAPGIRSNVGDPATDVVDKGAVTRDIIAAPEGPGAEAQAATPQ